ncbi:MAG: cytidine deaminase [Deltaproteobacteria bacterium]|nr:cytidine deaminase [Deltaproteobacteria bacterium]MBI4794786.1 cytidine deaminase [Deltaproteobacteria bacterium]
MTPSSLSEKERALLLAKAREAVSRAYAPYSHFRVGAAVLTEKGDIFTGVNVENASYGLTVCAERAAIFTAVAQEGPEMRLKALAVVSDHPGPSSPCGACRQVIWEFGPEAIIIFPGKDGLEEVSITRLLPGAFSLG